MLAKRPPKTLQEAIVYFSDPDTCLAAMVRFRWPDGVIKCPTCGNEKVAFIRSRMVWECSGDHSKRQFSVKVGTVMEDSPIKLDKWLVALWLISSSKNGVSSYELSRSIGVTQKSAWFMLHRIRLAMQDSNGGRMGGSVEVDETYIGGKARFMSGERKRRLSAKRPFGGKVPVFGVLQRSPNKGESKVATVVMDSPKRLRKAAMHALVSNHVDNGSTVNSDALKSYQGLDAEYIHAVIDHSEEYARGTVHTNGLENYWSLLKRTLRGTYISVEPFHLFRYLDEQCFRFNHRKLSDAARFALAAAGVFGKRLTFAQLTAADTTC
jgi:transposase-like protein